MTEATTRRERVRAATLAEIKDTARRHLVRHGPAGVSLRAIARDMGMTAPALYRYFPNFEALVADLCSDLGEELTSALVVARDLAPAAEPIDRLAATCREFRRWGLAHPAEFGLVFGAPPVPGPTSVRAAPDHKGKQMAGVFFESFFAHWHRHPFPIPEPSQLPPSLRRQLEAFAAELPVEVPVGLGYRFLSCWIQLYGTVALEVFGHLHFALTDAEAMFEAELARWVADLSSSG